MINTIVVEGEYTWKIPCEGNTHAGFEITINSGKPSDVKDAQEVSATDGYSGLTDGFVRMRGYNEETGWESEWLCSLESFINAFASRIPDGILTINGEKVEKM